MFKVLSVSVPNNIIVKYLFFHCIISGVYISAFVYHFAYPKLTILLHFLPLLCFNACLYFFLNLSVSRRDHLNRYLWIGAFSIVFTLYFSALLIVYILNWVSNANWGSNIVFSFILSLPKQIESVLIIAQISHLSFYLIAAMVLFAIYIISYRLSSSLWSYTGSQSSKPKLLKKLVYSGLAVTYITFYIHLTYERNAPRIWASEPIINIATLKSDAFDYPVQRMEAKRDQELQSKYRREIDMTSVLAKPRKNVIVIIADALRADHMEVYGYHRQTTPFLNELQENGKTQIVKTAVSTCSESACGIVSVLSSRRFKYVGYGLYQLHDLLKDVGYQTHFILGSAHNLNNLQGLYGSNVDYYTDGRHFPDGIAINDDRGVIDKLRSLEVSEDKPMFIYIHLMSSHVLSIREDDFLTFKPLAKSFLELTAMQHSDEKVILSTNNYDNGVIQTDFHISEIFNILKNNNILEDSLVVITSDHGDGLGEHGNYRHTYNLYSEETNIPMIYYNAGRQLENLRYATHIDIAPTIVDLLELPVFESWQGESLVVPASSDRITFHQTIRKKKEIAVILENEKHLYKLMATLKNNVMSNYRLFDLYDDHTEANNIIERDVKLTSYLKVLLKQEFIGNINEY